MGTKGWGRMVVRLRVQGLGFRYQGLGFRVQGLGSEGRTDTGHVCSLLGFQVHEKKDRNGDSKEYSRNVVRA